MRLCMSEITLRSNQIIMAVATSSATNATSTLTMRMTQTSQLSPWEKSGSPRPWLGEVCGEAVAGVVAAVEPPGEPGGRRSHRLQAHFGHRVAAVDEGGHGVTRVSPGRPAR